MIILIFSLQTLVFGFSSCSETNYENLVLDPTNPFYKEQFQMNKNDFQKDTDSFGFGFWSQYRPYQDILEEHQVDQAYQPYEYPNGDLLFSIRNVDTNQFETAYFLFQPLFQQYIYQQVVQLNDNNDLQSIYLPSTTLRYEGFWIYTHFQFIPLKSQLLVYFFSYQMLQYYTLDFNINQYGNKEIIIGGTGKIFNQFNLKVFHGRMSKPIQLQLQQAFTDPTEFIDHYQSCNAPKSCSSPMKIDIIKDQLYMDSTMYIASTVKLYENAYSFGGWVKIDLSNIYTRIQIPLLIATINKDYHQRYQLGDESFKFDYLIDQFTNMSQFQVLSYSYDIPKKGTIYDGGQRESYSFFENVQQNIQDWHFIIFIYGDRKLIAQILFPRVKLYYSYQFFYYSLGSSQFTSDYLYLHIGATKYDVYNQFQGWIQDFQIWTCLEANFTPFELICHFTCSTAQGLWCEPNKCEGCPDNTHRSYLKITKQCECEEGYYTITNQPNCEQFSKKFQALLFFTFKLLKTFQCQLGYYQYQSQCYECPLKIMDPYKISCLECINNKLYWYLNPTCETDYAILIGDVDEPFYSRSRQINEVDLFKINLFNYLELCQGCYKYCVSVSFECFLSNHYHLGNQMIVQCKQNYYFDQSLLECHKCANNCETCNQLGECVQCTLQHYFDPRFQECLQCDIRCLECQYDLLLNQQVCISCPEYFTLYNGICLKCGVYCRFCKADHYKNYATVYTRCYQCLDNKKYFISFDGINCHINDIQDCIYAFQYYEFDRHFQTIDMLFEPMNLNSQIITACAKCKFQYMYIISERICIESFISECEYCIRENRYSTIVVLSELYAISYSVTRIQKKEGCFDIQHCEACINSMIYGQMIRCSLCQAGYYLQRFRGNCLKCPAELNCQFCAQQQKINKDYFKLEFKAFYEWFVNFDNSHNFEENAQSKNEEDFEIVCTICHYGYQLINGACLLDCPENCAECTYNNGELQCLRCYDTIQGAIQTLVNNKCIQCPFNCAVCLPQDSIKVYQYNPYFKNVEYYYFTNLCLRLINQLPQADYFYDPEIGNFIQCGELEECYQEVHFKMIVHCNDQSFNQLLQQSSNEIEFRQQNIKLSQLFSSSTDPHIPEYENDIVYKRFNEKSIKKINQTYIFTNHSECVIYGNASLRNKFPENVYSIKDTHINLIGINDNVKIYISHSLYLDGYSNILIKNVQLFNTASNPVISIIISHLIKNEITLEKIEFTTVSQQSTISLSAFNSSTFTINDCQATNLNFMQNNFINIQNPIWQFQGLDTSDIMKLNFDNFSLINCKFRSSSLIHNRLDTKFIFNFKNILIQAEFVNSFYFTSFETSQFTKKSILLDTINIQSKIIDTDGFLNLQFIDVITIKSLNYHNSIISNSTFIKGNSKLDFDDINFFKLQIIGNSILLKYQESVLASYKNIRISKLNISEVSYEQINPFINFVDNSVNNQLNLTFLNLEGNYLTKQFQKSKLKLFYYSALIYVEMQNIYIANSYILRMPGYQEFALVNTSNIIFLNSTINQKEQIKGLHQYFDCQQQQNYGNQYFSVISIFQAKYTFLNNIQASKLILYNNPLIQYQSIDLAREIQQEILKISQCVFSSNLILISQDTKSSSIILIKSEQQMEIEINQISFNQNQLNTYSKGKSIHSCMINIQCLNSTVNFYQLEATDNLVTNDTNALFYLNVKQLILTNSQFLRNNYFDYEKVKGNLMWSFPNNISQITTESLQNIFPIKSDGIFIIIFEVLLIDSIKIRQAQGCKGGAFQLYTKQNGIVNITKSNFTQIRASLNCDQSQGGVFYLDSTQSKIIASISQIYLDDIMSLNLGGFIYVLSASYELNITISNVEAINIQSLKGSFLYASLQQQKSIAQELHIYNCSLTNEFSNFIEYLGYLSIFQNLDIKNLLKDRVQFFFINGQFSMEHIIIHTLNYESFIYVGSCIQMEFVSIYLGGGNYSNNPLFNIQFDPLIEQKLNFYDIMIQNLNFLEDTKCENSKEYKIAKLTLLCQQSLYYNLPIDLQQIISTDFLQKRGLCYFKNLLNVLTWESFSFIKVSYISVYHLMRIKQIDFQNNTCYKCENGLLNLVFEQGLNNQIEIMDLNIFNSSCGTLGCLVLSSGQLDQSTLLFENIRLLSTLEQDYYNMNFTFKIYRYTCLQNTANFGVCLFIHNIELQIVDSQFFNNKAIVSGGTVYSTNTKEQLSFIRTVMEKNTAEFGNSVIFQNQMLPNFTKAESFPNYLNTSQLISAPQQLKITKSNHLYYQQNLIQSKNTTFQLDISMLDQQFLFPNGQSLASYQYFDLNKENYIQLNLSFRLIALNNLDQIQIKLSGTKCDINSRIVQNLEDNVEFTQNYTNLKFVQFNSSTADYNLDDLILYFDSDLQNTMFLQLQFTCNSIKVPIYSENDPYNIKDQHDQYFLRTTLIKPLPCQIGEIKQIDTHICHLCDSNSGLYSVTFNSNKCQSKNDLTMISVTSAQINLKEFYWRPYVNSDLVENCFNLQSNCNGSWQIGDKSCFTGHIGALCEQCDLYNIRGDGQYSMSSAYVCGSCTSIQQNILIIGFASTFTLLSIIISVKSTDELITVFHQWKKHVSTGILISNEKALPGILLKILTNYFQIVGSLSTFKLQMPIWITSVITTSSDPIQQMTYSLDCFLIDIFQIPILYSRIIWHFVMLAIYILTAIILFILFKIKSRKRLRQGIISTILIYTFIFLQPNIVKSLISSISYRNISGYKWVQGHVAYRYDSDIHQLWLPYLVVLLIFIGILLPGYFFYKLFQIKGDLNKSENRQIWGFLYNEYTKWAYYWELVKIILRVMIIIILTYYEDSIIVKAIIMNLCLILYQHYLCKWKPYNLMFLNKLETLSSTTCSLSMLVGLCIYSSQQQQIKEVQYPLFIILFIYNVKFLSQIFNKILFAYSNKFQDQLDELKEKIKQKFPKLQYIIPGCIKLLVNHTQRKLIIKQNFKQVVQKIMRQQRQLTDQK